MPNIFAPSSNVIGKMAIIGVAASPLSDHDHHLAVYPLWLCH